MYRIVADPNMRAAARCFAIKAWHYDYQNGNEMMDAITREVSTEE